MGLFLPKQNVFFNLLDQICGHLKAEVALFADFAAAFNKFESFAQRAKEIEHRADEKTHEIIDKLNKTFITPFDREDIYQLAHELDDIIDLIENAVHNVYLYRVDKKISAFDEFAALFQQSAQHLEEMLDCLEHKKYTSRVTAVKIKIHGLEDRGDAAFAAGISRLFAEEANAVAVVKYKDILECLEQVMDKFQAVSDLIEGIIVKST